ncbi:MAG: hypothetical protein ACK46X_07310 [Candidatus Sericytochromatia bacterium]
MPLDQTTFDMRFRIRYWLQSLDEEQRTQLRLMAPEESLRFLFEGARHAPPLVGRPT